MLQTKTKSQFQVVHRQNLSDQAVKLLDNKSSQQHNGEPQLITILYYTDSSFLVILVIWMLSLKRVISHKNGETMEQPQLWHCW